MTDLGWIAAPLAGCLVAVGILGALGLHVLRRQVIFVDLALAQIAALGATYAFFLGFEPESVAGSAFALLFCFGGAALFATARAHEARLPQEAIIGICYVVAAAAAVLLVDLAKDPHGAERIRFLLVGSIVWAKWGEIGVAAAVCGGVGAFHWVFRRRFELATSDPAALQQLGGSLLLWDLLFYASFGIAITAIVRLIGVLLVFSYLIIPGAVAALFFARTSARLVAAWGIGAVVSFVGLLFGYEHPPGPVIVCCFGVVLAVALMARSVLDSERRGLKALQLAAGAALLASAMVALPSLLRAPSRHAAHGDEELHLQAGELQADPALGRRDAGDSGRSRASDRDPSGPGDADGHQHLELPATGGESAALASTDALSRQEAIDRLVAEASERSTALLLEHLPAETDEELRLRIATALAGRARSEGRAELERLATGATVPFVRLLARTELSAAATAPPPSPAAPLADPG